MGWATSRMALVLATLLCLGWATVGCDALHEGLIYSPYVHPSIGTGGQGYGYPYPILIL